METDVATLIAQISAERDCLREQVNGSKSMETMLHRDLHGYREHLEWFERCHHVERTFVDMCFLHGGIWVDGLAVQEYDHADAARRAAAGYQGVAPYELPNATVKWISERDGDPSWSRIFHDRWRDKIGRVRNG